MNLSPRIFSLLLLLYGCDESQPASDALSEPTVSAASASASTSSAPSDNIQLDIGSGSTTAPRPTPPATSTGTIPPPTDTLAPTEPQSTQPQSIQPQSTQPQSTAMPSSSGTSPGPVTGSGGGTGGNGAGAVFGDGGANPSGPLGGGTAGSSETSVGGSDAIDAGTPSFDPLEPVTVWLAGDSTVANGNTPCPTGWGKHFAPFFDDLVTVVNSAVGGRSVRTWMYNVGTEMDGTGECELARDANGELTVQARWQQMLDEMQPGDTLLIQFGINDGSPTCDRHVGLDAFVESYGVMAEAAKARGAQPVFITPVSMVKCSGSTAVGSRGAYVDATFEAGTTFDVPVLDLHQLSVDLYDELDFCPIEGGDVSASTTGPVGDFFCDDHTHFSNTGAPEIAALVAAGLRELGVGLAEHAK